MKNRIWLLSLIIVTFFYQTAFSQIYNYKETWDDSGLLKTDNEGGTFQLHLKNSPLLKNLNLGSVTTVYKNKIDKNKLFHLYKSSTDETCKWTTSQSLKIEIRECLSTKKGSLFRFAYNNQTHNYSMGTVNLRFLMPTYIELHLWQISLLGQQPSRKKTASLLKELLLQIFENVAYAQTAGLDRTAMLNQVLDSYFQRAGSDIIARNSVLTQAASPNGFNFGIDVRSSSVDSAAGEIKGLSNTFANTISAQNFAKLGLAFGATFGITSTLSGMLTRTIVEGSMSAIESLVRNLKGEFSVAEKDKILTEMSRSMKRFGDNSAKLETLMNDLTSSVMELSQNTNTPGENAFLHAIMEQASGHFEQDKLTGNVQCGRSTVVDASRALLKLKQVSENMVNHPRTDDEICQKIQSLYSAWVTMEQNIIEDRMVMVKYMSVLIGQHSHNMNDLKNNFSIWWVDRKSNNMCEDVNQREYLKYKASQIFSTIKCDIDKGLLDLNHPDCMKLISYHSLLKACEQAQNQKALLTERDEAQLIRSNADMVNDLVDQQKALYDLDCDPKKDKSCENSPVNKMRDLMNTQFELAMNKCVNMPFSKRVADKVSQRNRNIATCDTGKNLSVLDELSLYTVKLGIKTDRVDEITAKCIRDNRK